MGDPTDCCGKYRGVYINGPPNTVGIAVHLAAEIILADPSTVEKFPDRNMNAIERALLYAMLDDSNVEEAKRVEQAAREVADRDARAAALAAERAARVDQVYLIRERGSKRCKIGHSIDVADRLRDLQSGSSRRLYIAATIPGGEELERELHARFAQERKLGEWFRVTPEIEAAFRLGASGEVPAS